MEKGTEAGKIGEQIQDIVLLSQRDTASWNRLQKAFLWNSPTRGGQEK